MRSTMLGSFASYEAKRDDGAATHLRKLPKRSRAALRYAATRLPCVLNGVLQRRQAGRSPSSRVKSRSGWRTFFLHVPHHMGTLTKSSAIPL